MKGATMAVKFEGDALFWNGKKIAPSIRKFGDMRPVLAFPEREPPLDPDTPTYFMYRQAEKFGHIRYDVTKIPALAISGEFNKTFGHVHPKSKKGTAWPEAYEVLEGTAHSLLQKVDQLGVSDAVLITAKKGESFLVPPGYGHVTINPGKGDLVMGNLVSELFESDYSMYAQRRGACFYETVKGELVRNRNYGQNFEIRRQTAREFSSPFGCYEPFEKGGLLAAAKSAKNIEFLEKPELFY